MEKLNIHREDEEKRKAEDALREQQKLEEERLKQEREERQRQRDQEQLAEIQKKHIMEKLETIAQTEIGKTVIAKMDEKELASLDTEAIMIKQVEELENQKRQLIARLKAQEKKVDHLERAKRKEEIPLIQKDMIKVFFVRRFKKNILKHPTLAKSFKLASMIKEFKKMMVEFLFF